MCGRFTLSQSADAIAKAFQVDEVPEFPPRYNIAPTQPVPVVRMEGAQPSRKLVLLYWGLVPSWANDLKMGVRMINARAETVAEKPSFRTAFKRRRCLIIADGFYEWQKIDGKQANDQKTKGKKQPFYFQVGDHQPFAFAGIWEHWEGSGEAIESCAILTTEANQVLQPVHERMPVILQPEDYEQWLDPSVQKAESLQPLLRPYPPDTMQRYPVSPQVNSPSFDTPDCIQPVEV